MEVGALQTTRFVCLLEVRVRRKYPAPNKLVHTLISENMSHVVHTGILGSPNFDLIGRTSI